MIMNGLPIVLRVLLNIIIYIFYVLVASVLFSFLFPLVLQLLGQEILSPKDPIFEKIQIFIALLVLIVSLIFRKYFYISLGNPEEKTVYIEKKQSYTTTKKTPDRKEAKKSKTSAKKKDDTDEEIKIYVEKEIK